MMDPRARSADAAVARRPGGSVARVNSLRVRKLRPNLIVPGSLSTLEAVLEAVRRKLSNLLTGKAEDLGCQPVFFEQICMEERRIIRAEHKRNAKIPKLSQRMLFERCYSSGRDVAGRTDFKRYITLA